MTKEKRVPCLLWPFWAVWRLIVLIVNLTGRLVGAAFGLVLVIVGVLLSITIIGAVVGIPLIIFGFMIAVRSIF